MKDYDAVVVGCGFSGATAARCLAEGGLRVLVVEKRNHIGGNCYDYYDDSGVLVHAYGPHIFHTFSRKAWEFLSRFTRWRLYQHQVKAFVDGRLVSIPVNLNTMEDLFNRRFTPEDMRSYIQSVSQEIHNPENSEQIVLSRVGKELYAAFFENYTHKQWGLKPSELGPEVCGRIPVRYNRDDRYFTDTYQGVPASGYTRLFQAMLDHDNISLLLQTDYFSIRRYLAPGLTIFTGELDSFFDSRHGRLPYRSIQFQFESCPAEEYQKWPVVNYPNDYDFTRITEYKKLTGQSAPCTTVSLEYPGETGIPCYPVPTKEAGRLAQKYLQEGADLERVRFLGRLGRYQYINMDRAVLEAMDLCREVLTSR